MDATVGARLRSAYEDLHRHPELSDQEHRTAGIAAEWLRQHGYQVHEGVGTTGVVGMLRRGDGPTVLLRADMDALPVSEATGLPYASAVDGVMHACGHDMHVTCLLGAAAELAAAGEQWHGTLIAAFQPAEELATGAQGMVDAGLYDKVPRPDIVLGQHVAPLPAGMLGLRPGAAFAASDSLRITLHGRGGHGSRPETTVDPVVLAAATVLRLQTIVSREVSGSDTAVLTVGASNAGTKSNIIPDRAELLVNVRTYSLEVRTRILAAIERIVRGEAQTAGAPQAPTIEPLDVAPDVGVLAQAAGAPIVYWLLGGAEPAHFAGAASQEQLAQVVGGLPSNHSPHYYPVPNPTIEVGVGALVAAARNWLG